MKAKSFFAATATVSLLLAPGIGLAQTSAQPFVYDTPKELFGTGDFDGDGKPDVVIVDKESGKYRLGYQLASGLFNWVDCRPSGLKGLSGVTIGKLFASKPDGLAFTAPDANSLSIVDVSSPTAPGRPTAIPFTAGLGPNTVVAVDIGGEGNSPVADLYVASMYNSPDPSQATLLRNDGAQFPKILDVPLTGTATHGNHIALKAGQPASLCIVVGDEKGDTLRIDDLSSGKTATVTAAPELPAGADYAVGSFRNPGAVDFLVYKPGANQLLYRPVEESGGKMQLGKGTSFDIGQPVKRVVTLGSAKGQKLLVIFGQGEKAGIFNFDGSKAPALAQALECTNGVFTCAANSANGFVVFSQPAEGKFSTKYQMYNAEGDNYLAGVYGSLPSLADNDNITIPDIHRRIAEAMEVKDEKQMHAYTNTIPGTRVTYAMVAIPGGEFVMGSPEGEPDRKPDEGPQHKVKISPFWMGQFEVTWNEYELFMYPDEEKRTRATVPTDSAGDKLADAVTHPSKPYVEMSFGMGKDGYPAISMTQHAANKYCQWLSAKTGHFYRLPTEAEWEYAARAGTTGSHFFGDASKLGEYAWYEQNSDFKYQKVGKKKPNPWGLYDIYGNVVEWVLDQYDPDFYQKCKDGCTDPWNRATKPYPHAVRGGSWDDEAKMCRSAARRGSERAWKMQDPQLPKSVWYFSDAQWVGFRIVRPLKVPPPEEMQKSWVSGVERD
jgi:formylglycine-generating enzyme required for sulfatase activity